MRFLYVIAIFVGSSCSQGYEDSSIEFTTQQFSLKLKETVPINPWYVQLIPTDSVETLVLYNHFKSQFQFLDLNTGNFTHEILIRTEGQNGISGFNMGSVLQNDSLWFTSRPASIGLLNFDGEVLLRKKLVDDLEGGFLVDSNFDRPLYKYKTKIFGSQALFADHHRMGKNNIKQQKLIFSYDVKTDSVFWYDVFYKESFWDEGKKPSGFSWAERNGKLYIAPYNDHELQVFDLETESIIETREVKSRFVNKFNYVNELPLPGEGLKNRFATDRYSSLLYDKYWDVFYRLYLPRFSPDDFDREYNFRDLETSRPVTGILVLDNDLTVIGDFLIEGFQVFSSHNHFVGKNGLYLSANNVFNPEYNEEELRYLIFKFELRKK